MQRWLTALRMSERMFDLKLAKLWPHLVDINQWHIKGTWANERIFKWVWRVADPLVCGEKQC